MAQFLILATESDAQDSDLKWKQGQIVEVREDGDGRGLKEVWPKFGWINVPGLSKASAVHYMDDWRTLVTFNIMNHNTPADSYRVRVTSETVSSSGKGSFNQQQVSAFLSKWNATIVSFQPTTVTFDISVFDAVTSDGFWEADTSGVVFSESSYDSATGDHVIQVISSPFSNTDMKIAVEENGGIVIPPDSFAVNNEVVRNRFVASVKERLESVITMKRRWYVNATGMAALAANNGEITVTAQQLLNNVNDALLD